MQCGRKRAAARATDVAKAGLGAPPYNAFSVLRAKFDEWFAGVAEQAGAFVMPGIRVDEPVVENGALVGVRAGDDVLRAPVVVSRRSWLRTSASPGSRTCPQASPPVITGVLRDELQPNCKHGAES
jgi:hypothetical protein